MNTLGYFLMTSPDIRSIAISKEKCLESDWGVTCPTLI